MSRRSVVLAAIALALAGCGEDADTSGTDVVDFDIASSQVERKMPVTAVVPDQAPSSGRSMLVFLHGRSNDNRSNLDPELFDAVRGLGDRAPVIVFPDGDEDKYWHDRASGRWGSYVLDEVIPQAAKRLEVDRSKVAIGGISMGGFGALDLAARAERRFCAAGGHSPALWQSAGETAPGAFDDADDFARHDVIRSASALTRQPVWLDGGDEDPFDPGIQALRQKLAAAGAKPAGGRFTGGHERSYWREHWDEYIPWYAGKLARC